MESPSDDMESYYQDETDVEQLLSTLRSSGISNGYPFEPEPGSPLLADDERDRLEVMEEGISYSSIPRDTRTEDEPNACSESVSMNHTRHQIAYNDLEEITHEGKTAFKAL